MAVSAHDIARIAQTIVAEVEVLSEQPVEDLDEEIFYKSGKLDSMSMLSLVLALEQKYEVSLPAFFEDRPTVASVNALASYVASRIS